ncbi:MAG: hypothetical protein WA213_00425 [Terriglobales bacterium]
MRLTPKRLAWILLVIVVAFFHLLIGTLIAIATVFYWFFDKRMPLPMTSIRLSDTPETQTAFRNGVAKVFSEAGLGDDLFPKEGLVDGLKFCEMVRRMNSGPLSPVFENVKPEYWKQFLNYGTLLEACSHLSPEIPGIQNVVVTMFSPVAPTTPETAEIQRQLIEAFVAGIP